MNKNRLTEFSSESSLDKVISKRRGEIFRTKYLPSLKAFPGAKELLKLLKDKGLKLVVASSSSSEDLKELLKVESLIDFFDNLNTKTPRDKSK